MMFFRDCAKLVLDSINPSAMPVDTPYVGLEHIEKSTLQLNSVGSASEVVSAKRIFKKNDILVGKLGVKARKVVQPDFDGICSTDIWVIRPVSGVNSKFLFYWCGSRDFINNLSASSDGTIMPRANWDMAAIQEVVDFDQNEQRIIGRILGNFDDKIRNNRKLIDNLDSIAKAIYHSWFVKFDPVNEKFPCKNNKVTPPPIRKQTGNWRNLFPNELVGSELGLIPKGWKVVKLDFFGNVVCGKTPSTKNREYFGGFYPFITIPDMHNAIVNVNTRRTISRQGATRLVGKVLPARSICVSCIATPGLVCLTTKESFTNQQINSIIPHEDIFTEFLLYSLRNLKNEIQTLGDGGSVFTNLSTSKFRNIKIIVPDRRTLKAFRTIVDPLMQRLTLAFRENKVLTELRDYLLPKLISGELRIPEAEKQIEEVGIL